MGVIDIGEPAIDRALFTGTATLVNRGNSANDTGTIDTVKIWANVELSDCEVATFLVVSGDNLSTRDSALLGTVTSGSEQTFSGLDIDVELGNYIGIYFPEDGKIRMDNSGGDGYWRTADDSIPSTNKAFQLFSGRLFSLNGTGVSVAVSRGWMSK